MQLRRPLAVLLTTLALFGGSATMTACSAAGQDQKDGTNDGGENRGGDDPGSDEQGNLPSNTDPEQGDDETTDPD